MTDKEIKAIEKVATLLNELNDSEEVGYRNLILGIMLFERGLSIEDLEIDFTTWWESNAPSILNNILAGEEVEA
jgi:hypothetical protein